MSSIDYLPQEHEVLYTRTIQNETIELKTQNLTITDPIIHIGYNNGHVADTNDLGMVFEHQKVDGATTIVYDGLIRDATDSVYKLVKDCTTIPSASMDLDAQTLAPLACGALTCSSVTTAGLLDGVDLSAFKADYDSKVTQDVRATASPTFVNVTSNLTGNVTGNVAGNLTGNITGTVLTATQASITTLGSVTSIAGGNIRNTSSLTSFGNASFTGSLTAITCIGTSAGSALTGSGGANITLVGPDAGGAMIGGASMQTVCTGPQAGKYINGGAGNCYYGYATGRGAVTTNTGTNNAAYGNASFPSVTSGSNNSSFGYNTLSSVSSGSFNASFGDASGSICTTGSQNTTIGAGARTNASTATNRTALGYGSIATVDNTIVLGNASVTSVAPGFSSDNLCDLGTSGNSLHIDSL